MNTVASNLTERHPPDFGQPAAVPSVRALAGSPERVFGAQALAVYRDEARVLQKLKTLAAAAGGEWFYRFPVKKKGGGTDWIEGASIKLANDLARIYGNCDVDTRVIDIGDSWLFYARFTDFETGFSLTRPYQQRKAQASLRTDDPGRANDIAFQIGASKAIRNVVVNALQTFADYSFEEARNSLVNKIGGDLEQWRDRTLQGLGKIPVEVRRVELVVGRAAKDWLAADVARVIAMMKAIADGMATVDETFPDPDKPEPSRPATVADALDQFGGGGGGGGDGEPEKPADPPPAKRDGGSAAERRGAKADKAEKDKPPGPPKNTGEYLQFVQRVIEDSTDAERLKAWFVSDQQRRLRNNCGIASEDFATMQQWVNDRVAALQAA